MKKIIKNVLKDDDRFKQNRKIVDIVETILELNSEKNKVQA